MRPIPRGGGDSLIDYVLADFVVKPHKALPQTDEILRLD